jgi:hypothetical protein
VSSPASAFLKFFTKAFDFDVGLGGFELFF